ncbi:hypothetical protein ACHAW6_008455 [Cyclotella cf. meneghiniana]
MPTPKPQAKQNEKTKQYWDSFYCDLSSHAPLLNYSEQSSCSTGKEEDGDGLHENDVGGLERIVDNSDILLDELLNMFPQTIRASPKNESHARKLNVLEIGCGVSELSRSLLEKLVMNRSQSNETGMSYGFVATDVSSVCVDRNRKRDKAFITSLVNRSSNNANNTGSNKSCSISNCTDSLSYETLDVLTQNPTVQNHYDIILDKGTLDTFLFRSKRTHRGTEAYPPILVPLLNNIHSWLRHDVSAKYIFISPRSKIKAVRDYNGFAKVRRVAMDVAALDGTVLVQRNNTDSTSKRKNVFIYECIRNDQYRPERDWPFRSQNNSDCAGAVDDRSMCPHCKQSFRQFRGKVEIRDQGVIVWGRRWNNHLIHCKGL